MKRTPSLLFALLVCSSTALAATSLRQTVSIQLDKRFGLHLHDTTWDLNLNSIPPATCYRAGEHKPSTGRDALYTSGGTFLGLFNATNLTNVRGDSEPDPYNPYSIPATRTFTDARVQQVSGYPGLQVSGTGKDAVVTWKGPIFCTHQSILEKFSNALNGYKTTVTLGIMSTPGGAPFSDMPNLVVLERETGSFLQQDLKNAFFLTPPDPGPKTLSDDNAALLPLLNPAGATTKGWADGNLLTALLFDGRERAGTYKSTLTFNLADFSAP